MYFLNFRNISNLKMYVENIKKLSMRLIQLVDEIYLSFAIAAVTAFTKSVNRPYNQSLKDGRRFF